MSNAATKKMIGMYMQSAPVQGAFTSLLRAPAENYYASETVEVDIERSGEEIAPVVTDIKDGNNKFSLDEFVNKEFKAPVMMDEFTIDTFKLLKRQAGDTPFESPNYRATLAEQFVKHMRKGGERQRRTLEKMAAQMFQTGTITLKDAKGADAYTIDFAPKATHFPTVSTAWSSAGATPLADIKALCDVINTDGQSTPYMAWFGDDAYQAFITNEEVLAFADNRGFSIVNIAPVDMPTGAIYMGTLVATGYRLEMYTYRAEYKEVNATTNTRFLGAGNVIIFGREGRYDATYGSIPLVVAPDPRVGFLSTRAAMSSINMDMTTNAWVSQDGRNVSGFVGSRPLVIPTSIDRFGCLNTGV